MFFERKGNITFAVLILTTFCAAIFTNSALAKREPACSSQCRYDDTHFTIYYTEYKCKKWFCNTVVDTKYDDTQANSDNGCWRVTRTNSDTYYCDRHKPKPRCPVSTCRKTSDKQHHDIVYRVVTCSDCGEEIRRYRDPVLTKENSSSVCSESENRITSICDGCRRCSQCQHKNSAAEHTVTIVSKHYMCGHTKTETKQKETGGCRSKSKNGGAFCGGDNDQNNPCDCPFKDLSTMGDILDLATGKVSAWTLFNGCNDKLGGQHTLYKITVKKCGHVIYRYFDGTGITCDKLYDYDVFEIPIPGMCSFAVDYEYGTCSSCEEE